MEALLRHLDGDGADTHQQLLPCVLEVRGSTRPAATTGATELTGTGPPGG